eukprot:scaffold369605_cov24-Attheya_sp.AAC.1
MRKLDSHTMSRLFHEKKKDNIYNDVEFFVAYLVGIAAFDIFALILVKVGDFVMDIDRWVDIFGD